MLIAVLIPVLVALFVISPMTAYSSEELNSWLFKVTFALAAIEIGLILTMPSREDRLEYARQYTQERNARMRAEVERGWEWDEIDEEMEQRAREIALAYLAGNYERGSLIDSYCHQILDPESMRQAFKQKHGLEWGSPQALPLQQEWAMSWYDFRRGLDKTGALISLLGHRHVQSTLDK